MVKNLRKLRIASGMSQQQLADVIGTSQQSINKYENHNVEPDIATLIKLADHFQVSVDDLVGHAAAGAMDVEELALSREEAELISNYRRLSRAEKDSLRLIQRNYLREK